MKKIIFIIFVICELLYPNVKIYRKDGSLKSEIIYMDNNTTRVEKVYYKNGSILMIQPYKYNKQSGITKWYYKNKKLWMEQEYKNSQQDGFDREYTKDGTLFKESFYRKGKQIGVSRIYELNASALNEQKLDLCATCKQAINNYEERSQYEEYCLACIETGKSKRVHYMLYSSILIKEKKLLKDIHFIQNILAKEEYKNDTLFIAELASLLTQTEEYQKAFQIRKKLLYIDTGETFQESVNYINYLELELILNKPIDKKAYRYYREKFNTGEFIRFTHKLILEMLNNILSVIENKKPSYKIKKVHTYVKKTYKYKIPTNTSHILKWINTKPKNIQDKLYFVLRHYENMMK